MMIILLIFISSCFYEIAHGGGYQYSGSNDTGTVLSRLIFNPMNYLRDKKLPYIRDELFAGLFLMPIVYSLFILQYHLSWYLLPALTLGWLLGGMFANHRILELANSFKQNIISAVGRCFLYGGLYLFPAVITHQYMKAATLTSITAFLIPLIYFVCYKINKKDISTNVAEFLTGALIGGLSLWQLQ